MKKLLQLKTILLLGCIGGTMLWIGSQRLVRSGESTPVILQGVAEIEPDGAQWVEVKNCLLNVLKSAYVQEYSNTGINEIIVPIVLEQPSNNRQYYLQTTDTSLTKPFNQLYEFDRKIQTSQTNIELGQQDPEYLKFQQTTLEEQVKELQELKEKLADFVDNYPLQKQSVQGFLLSASEKEALGYDEAAVIIQHNALPPSGVYTWVLLIGGGLLSLMGVLSMVGLFSPKSEL